MSSTRPGNVVDCVDARVDFGALRALDAATFAIPPGGVHALLGPNGAGKTTLLRVLFGLVRLTGGPIRVLGSAPGLATAQAPGGAAGFVERPSFYPYLSATRNLALLAAMDDLDARDSIPAVLERVGLGDRGRQKVGGFSAGQKQRLGLAAALLRGPRLLVLDEPTTGLDPSGVADLHDIVTEVVGQGGTVLLSSHDMAEVELLCRSVTVLAQGKVVYDGALRTLRERAPDPSYLLVTSDDHAAAALLASRPGVHVSPALDDGFVVRASPAAMDAAVLALGTDGVAVRALRRQDTALEAMFTRLIEQAAG